MIAELLIFRNIIYIFNIEIIFRKKSEFLDSL